MKARAEETILAAREQKVKTALFKNLFEACKQPRMADVLIQSKIPVAARIPAESILEETVAQVHSAVVVVASASAATSTAAATSAAEHLAENTVATPGPENVATTPRLPIASLSPLSDARSPLGSSSSSPVPLVSPVTAHVVSTSIISSPPPIPVSRPDIATPLSMGSTDPFSLLQSLSSETSETPLNNSVLGGKTPLSINTPSGDDDPFGFAQIALEGLEFVSPPAKIATTTTSIITKNGDANNDDPFAIFSSQDR
jgi:hypothetical protein